MTRFHALRRLHAAAAAGLLALLTACGGDDAPAPPDVPPAATPPAITQQPVDVSVTTGQPAAFTVAASGTAPLTYQWQRNGSDIAGATSASYALTTTALTDSTAQFRAVVKNAAGSATSNPATLTVTVAAPVLTVTQQPADASVTAGAQAQFAVAATCSSGTLNIQWQRNTGTGGAFVAIASATSATYALTTAVGDTGAQFRAALDCDGQAATTSTAATLTVTAPTASVLAPVPVTGLRHQAPLAFSRGIVRESAGSYAFVSGNAVLRLSADLLSITPVAGSVDDLTGGTVDGVGAAAQFNLPYGITVDAAGNLYVTERAGHVVRRIATDGTVTTIAGTKGQFGSDEGTGSAARFYLPSAIAIGPDGDLYVADRGNQLIRRVTTAGVVTNYAGTTGLSGYVDGAAGGAKFYYPSGLAVGSDGAVYVADGNGRIRRIKRNGNAAGSVETLAGSGSNSVTALVDGTATGAVIALPEQMALSGTTLFVRDGAGLVRKIDTGTAVVTALAGTVGGTVPRDGPRGTAVLGVAMDGGGLVATPDGGVLVTETTLFLGAVRRVDATGVVTTLAVNHPNGFNGMTAGTGVLAQLPFAWFPEDALNNGLSRFSTYAAVAAAPDGSLVVGTRAMVRRIAASGAVSPVIGLTGVGTFDGKGSAGDVLNGSQTMVVDVAGVIYFSDVSTIRTIDATNTSRTLAGTPSVLGDSTGLGQGAVDGPGTTARFSNVTALTLAPGGGLYAADSMNYAIRYVDATGNVSTYAGALGQKGTADGTRATARFSQPMDLSAGPDGTLWLLDSGRNETATLRRIAPDGTVTTLPLKARRLTVDPAGNVYVITEDGDLAGVNPATGAPTVLVPHGPQLTFGANPTLGGDNGWAFSATGVKQLVLMSDHQLIRATLP